MMCCSLTNRQIGKTSPWYNYTGMGNWEMFDAMEMGKIVKEIVKVDDHTVKMEPLVSYRFKNDDLDKSEP
ncbi:hypothetical protein [Pseudochrobactrum asaccharolyticum]|uniref:hypothetical protein n=1 Tax=Pseudochrobactrum asaccharolyticum TaxID=354351 RepID=UPI0040431F97